MVRLFLLSLLALLGGLLLAINLARDPGYILIAYGNYTFETSLFALLVALLAILLLLRLLFTLLSWLNPMNLVRKLRRQPEQQS
jgi:HemY protein